MSIQDRLRSGAGRRDFLKAAATVPAMAVAALTTSAAASARPLSETDKLARIASNTWPVRMLFKSRAPASGRQPNPRTLEFKKKYGEITMLDFPQFTRDILPGLTDRKSVV